MIAQSSNERVTGLRFVDIDSLESSGVSLPPFIKRVPVMIDGTTMISDESLFAVFARPATRPPKESAPETKFSETYSPVDGDGGEECDTWMEEAYQGIHTPECEPLPGSRSDGAS